MPHDFPLAGAKSIWRKRLDDYSSSGTEVKSRLVATVVAYGNRHDCFACTLPLKALRLVVSLAASRGRRIAYSKQVVPKYPDVYGDSDWAGDQERKRSTTGAAEIFEGHMLDAVSVTQSLVALSSAEAEFYACNRGTAGGLQTCHFLTEAGYKVVPRVWSDSSACRGIVRRTGSGRLRHVGDPTHVDTGAAAEREVPVEGCSYEQRGGPDDEPSGGSSG